MLNFFKKKEDELNNTLYVKTAALLIHAAKIDQKYNEQLSYKNKLLESIDKNKALLFNDFEAPLRIFDQIPSFDLGFYEVYNL